MTREEAIAYFKRHIELYCVEGICREAEEMAIKALEQEPIAEERYQDLVEYFGDKDIAKCILEDREEYKKWLERMKWHVCKADELARKLEQGPCEDCVSKQIVIDVLKHKWNILSNANDAIQESIDTIEALPPVTPQYTDAEIQKMQEIEQAEIEKAYELGKSVDILDKIRAEIAVLDDADYDYEGYYKAITDAVKIIDKYK